MRVRCSTAPAVTEVGGRKPCTATDGSDGSMVDHAELPPHSPIPADGVTNVPVEFDLNALSWRGAMDCNCLGDYC
jgi:hypothetical protein